MKALLLSTVSCLKLRDWSDYGDTSFDNAMSSKEFLTTYDQDINPQYLAA